MLSIDLNLLFTIINLLILYAVLRKFLYKPVMGIMEQRQAMIDEQFKNAKDAQDKADELKSEWEQNMTSIEAEKERVLEAANNKAKAEYQRIVSKAEDDAKGIIENANKKIEADREKTMKEIEGQIAGLAMLAAAKIVNEKGNSLDNSAIYDDFLAKNEGK